MAGMGENGIHIGLDGGGMEGAASQQEVQRECSSS
jgi:hypothetical protein